MIRTLSKLGKSQRFLAPVAIAAGALLLWFASLLAPLEETLSDTRAMIDSRPPTGEIVVVEIDAKSLSEFQQWPLPRRHYARLVDRLSKVGARVVAFDVDFSANSGADDEVFAKAIARAGNVVLPIFDQPASSGANAEYLTSRPIAELGSAWVASVLINPAHDGTVRSYPAATFINRSVQPSLATIVAERSGLKDQSFHPDWSIELASIPRYSLVDVMEGRVDPARFRGKRVIVGGTAIELGDRYSIPRHGIVPGVYIHAVAAESLLSDRAIVASGDFITILGTLVIALLLAPGARRGRRVWLIKWAGALVVILSAPVILEHFWPYSLATAPWITTLLMGAAVWTFYEHREQLRQRSRTDLESHLPNRAALEETLSQIEGSRTLIVAKIERFGTLRDSTGLQVVNEAVVETARRIAEFSNAQIFRISPDMLAWVDGEELETLEDRLLELDLVFRKAVETSDGIVDVGLAYGFDHCLDEAIVAQIERAISAVGSARDEGKKFSAYLGPRPVLRRQVSLATDLREAIRDDRIELAYQPKFSLRSNAIESSEALVRWTGLDGARISPDSFIPLAEDMGIITEITSFVVERALSDLKAWEAHGVHMATALNVSACDLARPDFADSIEQVIQAAGIDPSRITLEVTEGGLIRSPQLAVATLGRLRQFGVKLSIDDYGTGRSTLSYLSQLPVHELKIDRSFVSTIATDSPSAILVKSTISMAHELGLSVVAEGVEDSATLSLLREWSCDTVQGYLIGKPGTAAELLAKAMAIEELRVA
ncbi:EAL domain-containing protein [Sphingomonas xanthus]|uniref:EAL domain-containing protein n=1 Tax=Sphingomonas xanthus TaxID=2594473 RepID=A0A516INL5_9SPHN|nr:EAL domain-containing protein [Sphingomonas xanthus]QDP18492.1 EAL domain-containing protein [Sphingomonas xanthus]